MDVTAFYQSFFEEADELLAEMEQQLMALDVAAPSNEELNAIFRAAHSIKGGAATFGFVALTETTHLLENILDRARHHEITLRTDMVDTFLRTKDALQEQISAYRQGGEPSPEAVEHICAVLRKLAEEAQGGTTAVAVQTQAPAAVPAVTPAPAASPTPAAPTPGNNGRLTVRFTKMRTGEADLLRSEMDNLGSVVQETRNEEGTSMTLVIDSTCTPDDIIAVCCFVVDTDQIEITAGAAATAAASSAAPPVQSTQNASAAGVSVVAAPAATAGPAKGSGKDVAVTKESTIRVDVPKVDQLINQVGELVITQAMLSQMASTLDPVAHEKLLAGIGMLERNARDLQESVMAVRMMPMDYVFSRFPRLIRDLSSKLGKQVELDTFGKDTELDKGLIERVIDPLTHLVRNSLDHGIEPPEKRVAAGKSAVGRVCLAAQHQGGNIVIEVSDDGGGLPRDKILAKAQQQGLPVSDSMSDEDVWQLIFEPGFSTAEKVTDVSGRGVGMDVVKRNIGEMGGHVQVSSTLGAGTTTRIVLPLTLAILNGMSVKVGEEVYILPLGYVIESLQPLHENIHSIRDGENVIHVRGEYLPLVELRQMLQVPGPVPDLERCIVVIVQGVGSRFALLVDQLVSQHQVVVKNLEANYRKVSGISGATILGDGSVALIVDIPALQPISRRRAS